MVEIPHETQMMDGEKIADENRRNNDKRNEM